MLAVLAWALVLVFLPSLAYAVCFAQLGRVSGPRISLLPCFGLAFVVVQLEFANRLGLDGWRFALGPAVTSSTATAVVLVFNRSGALRRLRELGVATSASAAAFSILSLPWAHVPTNRVLGYSQLPDQIQHALLARWIAAGEPKVDGAGWGWALAEATSGYPRGSHEILAALSVAIANPERTYSPALVLLSSYSAYPAVWALRRARVSTLGAILGGAFAAGCYLELGYSMQGFLPSMTATPLILAGLGLFIEAYLRHDRRLAVAYGIVIGAAADVYSLSIGIYFVVPVILCAVTSLARARNSRNVLRRDGIVAAIGGLSFVFALAPYAADAWRFFRVSSASTSSDSGGGSVSDMGNLFHPVPYDTIFGSWIGPDYRLDYAPGRHFLGTDLSGGHTRLGIACAALLLCVGVAATVWRRHLALPLALAGPASAAFFVHQTRSPYYTAKAYQVLAVFVVVAGVVGAFRLAGSPRSARDVIAHLKRPGGFAALVLLVIWLSAAARSDTSEARSASATGDFIRRDLPGLASASAGHRTVLLTLPQVAGTSLWSRLALPAAFSAEMRSGFPSPPPMDTDRVTPESLDHATAIVEYAVGGLSLPPPPFTRVTDSGMARIYTAPATSLLYATYPLEVGAEIGGHRLAPGASEDIAFGANRRIRLGVLDPDEQYSPLTSWSGHQGLWQPWDADPSTFVPTGAGVALSTRVTMYRGGLFRFTAIGRFDRVRLIIDGTGYSISGGDLNEPTPVAVVRLAAGTHELALAPAVPGRISFAKALAWERVGDRGPDTRICINGKAFAAAPDRPTEFTASQEASRVVNCGSTPAVLDWWQAIPE